MTPELYTYSKRIGRFFDKHHPVIFISFLTLLLGAAIYSLDQVIVTSTDTSGAAATSTVSDFDQQKQTIDKIKQLHISSDSGDQLVFPSQRANPFAE
jgi:hypothetical protein